MLCRILDNDQAIILAPSIRDEMQTIPGYTAVAFGLMIVIRDFLAAQIGHHILGHGKRRQYIHDRQARNFIMIHSKELFCL